MAFPTHTELEDAVFDMVVAGRVLEDGDVAIMMVEAEATEKTIQLVKGGAEAPTEEVVAAGLEAAKPFIKVLCKAQSDLAAKAAKPTGEFPIFLDYQDDVLEALAAAVRDELAQALTIAGKQDRETELDRVKALAAEKLLPQFEGREKEISAAYRSLTKKLVRERVIKEKKRIDGRGVTDIRTLAAEVEAIPRVHGSALFERGETQILGVTTLNMLRMEQQLDTLSPVTRKRYMHNYNFPPYSIGETGRVGSPKRREIGHGALAERALVPVLPTREEFPYAIRQVSEALGSNGSTSMGSVCASTMSLLNAGVPLKAPVAGIAMGLISQEIEGETHYVDPDRHPRCRGRLRRHGLQGRRHQGVRHRPPARHQAGRHPRLRPGRRPQAGPRRPPAHPRRDERGHRHRRTRCPRTPRGSSPSRSPWTRSARSSAPRAR